MAFKRKSSNKGIISQITPLALGIGGGVVGNQITGMVEKQSFMEGNEQYAPAVTLVAAAAAGMFLGNDMIKQVANGAAIVAGVELVESLIGAAGTPGAIARQMGYVPDMQSTGPSGYPTEDGGSIN